MRDDNGSKIESDCRWWVAVAIYFLAFLAVAYLTFGLFLSEIGSRSSGVQADYVLDGYYYIDLGQEAVKLFSTGRKSLYQAALDIQPNVSSGGVVYLSALIIGLLGTHWVVPLLLSFTIFLCLLIPIKYRQIDGSAWLILSGGLFPYFFIPSKEAFLVAGFLLLVYGYLKAGWGYSIAMIGLLVMYMARSEAVGILLLSLVAFCMRRNFFALTILFLVCAFGYLSIRDLAVAASLLTQFQADRADVMYCDFGPLNVCVQEGGLVEVVYIVRFFSLSVLPLKWVYDLVAAPFIAGLAYTDYIIRFFAFFQLIVLYKGWTYSTTVKLQSRRLGLQRFIYFFSFVYWFVYSSVFYFQPSRQALLCLTFVCIGLFLRADEDRSQNN
jgi:hypothetical protein